ncbi:thioredoxin family protein [Pedobacter ginsengisoli]|uniref:thioredoxin family protein n=1 Tax=Pedobacter ginsengisoli TaxID=363852 RepID=UPI00254E6A4B|nr:thioredoxin fold domain-containing protein [Pedobacter ginsengisoli]
MKKTVLSLALIGLTSLAFAQEKGIAFEKGLNWDQTKAKARTENKYIFVDVFATWCAPCKWMDKNVFDSEGLGKYINDRFISFKVQGDTSIEDSEQTKKYYSEAKQLISNFKVRSYPTFLFFSPKGELVHQFSGAVDDTAFITIVKEALTPEKQYSTLLRKFNKGQLRYEQMPLLAKTAKQLLDTNIVHRVADCYISEFLLKLKETELFTADHLTFINDFIVDTKSEGFKFFMKYTKKINAVLGDNKAEYAIRSTIARECLPSPSTWKTTKPDWDSLQKVMEENFGPLGKEVMFGNRMMYCRDVKDWQNFGKCFVLYFEKALKRPEYLINNIAWTVFEQVTDQDVLEYAIKVMRYDIETWDQQAADAYDTYANLLYKTGRKSLAVDWEEKAVKLKKGAPDESIYKDTLQKMLKGEKTW